MGKLKSWIWGGVMACLFCVHTLEGVVIQGHRGMRGRWPENSLPGFAAAVAAGVPTLELDLLVTQDGELVIYHDFLLNPQLCVYPDGTPVEEGLLVFHQPLAFLKQLDCGRQSHPQFPSQCQVPDTSIPTLQELFDFLENSDHPHARQVQLNLELKVCPLYPSATLSPPLFAEKVLACVKKNGWESRVYYSSFDLDVLKAVKACDPTARVGFILSAWYLQEVWKTSPEAWVDFVLQVAQELPLYVVSPDHQLLTEESLSRLHQAGLSVMPWTVNVPARCAELIRWGVAGIITDYPTEIQQSVNNPTISLP